MLQNDLSVNSRRQPLTAIDCQDFYPTMGRKSSSLLIVSRESASEREVKGKCCSISDHMPTPSLADDLLSGVDAIAGYIGESPRRVRYLIAYHRFPHIKRGQRIYSRKSWLEAYYSVDAAQPPADNGSEHPGASASAKPPPHPLNV
jgi:hypothetical protein